MEENKKINYNLRDYQASAITNIREIFNRSDDKYNRFAGVILPTGGGKSFVAIEELLEIEKQENGVINFRNSEEISNIDRTKEINQTPILYVAPSREILSQVKLHIVKNVILNISNLEDMSISEINSMMKEDFPYLNFQGIDLDVTDSSSASDKKKAIMRQISPEQITEMVRNAFPGLEFKCYAGVKENGDPEDEDLVINDDDIKRNFSLIILDEAHRVGAETWNENIKNLIRNSEKTKVLAITATPKRTDDKQKDMMQEIAKMVYDDETILPDIYMAKEIFVLDAMRDGIVTSPEVVDYPPSLAMSDEYKQISEKYKSARGKTRAELKEILNQMHELMGFVPGKTVDDLEEDNRIGETLQKNLRNRNGKYIAFIPSNRSDEGENLGTREYFASWEERIRKQFENVLDENGNPVKVDISFVTSDSSVQNATENSRVLKEFEDKSNETGGIKILVAIDKLNEGVHVDGIDGSFMYRPIGKDSSTLFLQQSGRCISSMDPSIKTAEDFLQISKEQIFDFSGNFLKQINNNIGGKVSRRYDLERIQEISNWVKDNGIPDINSNNLLEIRYAIAMKRLHEKYSRYSKGEIPLLLGETDKIRKIIEFGNDINLWETSIPERIIKPSEEEITGSNFLSFTDSQRKFMELYYKGMSLSKEREIPSDIRVKKLINTLKILKMHKQTLQTTSGIMIKDSNGNYVKSSDFESKSFEDFLSENFEASEIEKILIELENTDIVGADSRREVYHRGEKYDIGEEMAFVRGMLFTSNEMYRKTNRKSVFSNYNAYELISLGILDIQKSERGLKELFGVEKGFVDKKGFITSNKVKKFQKTFGIIEEIDETSIETGSKFIEGRDIDGYDEEGYDIYGFDRHGFNREKTIHKITGDRFDDRGFTWDKENLRWINKITRTEYDALGYNIDGFDEQGFERPHGVKECGDGTYIYQPILWHKKREDGTYEKCGMRVNPEKGLDAHKFRYENGVVWGYYGEIGKESVHAGFWSNGATEQHPTSKEDFYSYEGLDIDEFNKQGFKKVKIKDKIIYIHRDTSEEFDKNGNVLKIEQGQILGTKQHPAITRTKYIIKNMISGGKSIDEIYKEFATKSGCSTSEAQKRLENSVKKFIQITRVAPSVLEDEYFSKAFSRGDTEEKEKRIHEFFDTFPKLKERIVEIVEESARRITILDECLEKIVKRGQEAINAGKIHEAMRFNTQYNELKIEEEKLVSKKEKIQGYSGPGER